MFFETFGRVISMRRIIFHFPVPEFICDNLAANQTSPTTKKSKIQSMNLGATICAKVKVKAAEVVHARTWVFSQSPITGTRRL